MRAPRVTALIFVAACALPTCLLAMQLPALTAAYAADLAGAAHGLRAVIDRDIASVRAQYSIDTQDDGGVVGALRQFDVAHSEALGSDVTEWRGLEDAAERMQSVSPLFQPFAALLDLADDQRSERRAVWRDARDTTPIRLELTMAGLVYGFGGLMLGVLAAEMVLGVIAAFRRLARRIRRRRLLRRAGRAKPVRARNASPQINAS